VIKDYEEAFFSLLSVTDKLFKKHDIEYWLEAGSLIGAIREGTYIKWDGDMDISIHHYDIKRVRELKGEFADHGVRLGGFVTFGLHVPNASMCIFPLRIIVKHSKAYLVQYRYTVCGEVKKITGMLSSKLKEIFLKWKTFQRGCAKFRKIETIRSPLSNLGNFAFVEFCGTVCPIPEHPDEYITYMFGDWRTPHKFYKHKDVGHMYDVRVFK